MSVVASPPLPHQSFSDTEVYTSGSVSAHAELPPTTLPIPHTIPFPVFQHRHSSPYPAPQSFSVLGPPPASHPPTILGAIPPPPAPKGSSISLPASTPDIFSQTPLPPTPDPSPPASKVLSPTMMIKLAPPADDMPYEINLSNPPSASGKDPEQGSSTPRRLPLIAIDTALSAEPADSTPPPRPRTKSQSEAAPNDKLPSSDCKLSRPKSMGPPPRPRRSQTAHGHPAAVRMSESRSADSKARLRHNANMVARSTSGFGLTAPSNLARSSSDVGPPLAVSGDMAPPDLGGPDGLEAKVVLLGSQGVGKTSLILRYTTRTFSPVSAPATIGSSLHARKLVHDGVRVKLQIWDTAGQERFRSMAPIYYRGAHVCILVYDVTDRQSFQDVRSWLEELARTVPKETVIFVVGAKIDLERKRVIKLDHARDTIGSWLKPTPPPAPAPPLLSPPSRSIFRHSPSSRPASVAGTPPSRSHSHTTLATPDPGPSRPTSTRQASRSSEVPRSVPTGSVPFPMTKASPKPLPIKVPANTTPTVKIISATSPTSPKRISFSALQSPTRPTSATFTDPVKPSITPASSMSAHRVSGGRFSISGVLGMNRTTSLSGAASSLAQLAEMPSSPRQSDSPEIPRAPLPGTPTRVRVESTPLLSNYDPQAARRRSEDWSTKSWRMGEGPGAAEALGEFGAGVKKKESAELLASGQIRTVPFSAGVSGSGFRKQQQQGRARGGSLGRDHRLYGAEAEEPEEWGVEVEGIRLGECSALSGEGVEALFKSISTLLVEKKDKIERERVLRRKNSVMLVDPKDGTKAGEGSKGRAGYGCCA